MILWQSHQGTYDELVMQTNGGNLKHIVGFWWGSLLI